MCFKFKIWAVSQAKSVCLLLALMDLTLFSQKVKKAFQVYDI